MTAGFLAHAGRSVAGRARIELYGQRFARPGPVTAQFGAFPFVCIGRVAGPRDPPLPARDDVPPHAPASLTRRGGLRQGLLDVGPVRSRRLAARGALPV